MNFGVYPSVGAVIAANLAPSARSGSFSTSKASLCLFFPPPSPVQGSVRKATAPGLGGSDTCHFCLKRVYIMERLSAEGYFFHRECFRCTVCGCTLRLGTHSFDSQQGASRSGHMGLFVPEVS